MQSIRHGNVVRPRFGARPRLVEPPAAVDVLPLCRRRLPRSLVDDGWWLNADGSPAQQPFPQLLPFAEIRRAPTTRR